MVIFMEILMADTFKHYSQAGRIILQKFSSQIYHFTKSSFHK